MLTIAGGIILAFIVLMNLPLLIALAMGLAAIIVGLAVLSVIPIIVANYYSDTAALWVFLAEVITLIVAYALMKLSDNEHRRVMEIGRRKKMVK